MVIPRLASLKIPMRTKALIGICLALLATVAFSQSRPDDLDWKEIDAQPAPAFSVDSLIPVDMPLHMTLQFGVDPATLTLTSDGVVRYVMVASNPGGGLNAMYEGIRCATGEFRTYARASGAGPWRVNPYSVWSRLDASAASRPALALAKQGVCDGRSVRGNSVPAIVRALTGPR
jgi:CNP1-like family